MRAYHFLSAENALDDVTRKRVKISEIDKLNDPFELWCAAQGNKRTRRAMLLWKKEMARRFGVLCFCPEWNNPVLWSHYADSHRGMCLGFEIEGSILQPVRYVRTRPDLTIPPTDETARQLLLTKYWDWRYEKEWRGWCSLGQKEEGGNYFYYFDAKIRLREIVAGPLCTTPETTIKEATEDYSYHVRVIKSRLAFKTFQVVRNRRGFAAKAAPQPVRGLR